ncbi:hypothetical protein [Blautia massiliensis (ex Durand et al. 2017)]|uniref:hypothetical protein n=1 Tax=Blautia massiliensis (ex Durand et al. 2017) TaxID=1737424 RepID=UPI002430433F|nr:hypothetical protein [Blautia massiliensis (ex Durand et al. 2017)]MDD6549081.1 hypothetical protein [Blautia massiliensis (ex Durand et al. 2017)]
MVQKVNIVNQMADDMQIEPNSGEKPQAYARRVIYSALGEYALTAFLDCPIENGIIPVQHITGRMTKFYENLKSVDENLWGLPKDGTVLFKRIQSIYEENGFFYINSIYRKAAPLKSAQISEEMCLIREIGTHMGLYHSGIGFYKHRRATKLPCALENLFHLPKESPLDVWKQVCNKAVWQESQLQNFTEYLCDRPYQGKKYWKSSPTNNGISILRTGEKGKQLYYLYRMTENGMLISRLPEMYGDNGGYRRLATGLYMEKGTYLSHDVVIQDKTIILHQNYLLPTDELRLLKLYSWPIDYVVPKDQKMVDFNLEIEKSLYRSLTPFFEGLGYRFNER